MASSNYSLRSSDHVGDLFSVMFPDSKIAANFSLSHTSSSYIIGEGLMPYLTRVIIGDLVELQLPFCVHFDEASTTQVKKQMDLTLRYWFPTHNEVWSMFYTSLFFGHAEGVKVTLKMYERIQNDGIPVNKMVTLVRDGPNVNKTMFNKMNELIQQDYPRFTGLIDLGSCTIHTVHNAFGKGIEQYGSEIDLLCKDLYTLFQHSAARCEDYVGVQIEMEVEIHNFQQHTEVRWLSMGPSIKRVLKQWDAIIKFVSELAKDQKKVPKSINFKRVYMMLGTKERASTKVTLEFLNIIPLFEKFLLLFQKSSPVVHILYDSLCDILAKMLRRFLKAETMDNKYGSDLTSIDCAKYQPPDKEIVIGDTTRKILRDLTVDQQKGAYLGMRSFFKAATSHLQLRLPLQNDFLR